MTGICSASVVQRAGETFCCAVVHPHRPAYWIPLPVGRWYCAACLDLLNRLAPQHPTSQDGRT